MSPLRRRFQREDFDPTWFGVIANSSFLTRRGLRNGIRRHAPKLKGRMVDFGCGSKPYKNFLHPEEYIGVDVEVSGHPHKNEQVDVFYDGHVIPLPDSSVDSVLSSEVFEHVFDLHEVLAELNRILKPGGIMLVTCPMCWGEHEEPYDYGRYTRFGLRHRFEKAGFQVLLEEKEGHFIHAVAQLTLLYLLGTFRPHVPLLGRMVQCGWNVIINPVALALGVLLPTRWDFYLSNIFVVQKTEAPTAKTGTI